MTKTRIGIACQGGGSQTAFTAGALAHLLRAGVQEEFEIVSLSGTSGGALCAALAWCSLRLAEPEPWARLEAFWADNTAQGPIETAMNDGVLRALRWASQGFMPVINTTPYAPGMQAMMAATAMMLRPEYTDLGKLLARHLDLDAMAVMDPMEAPVLLIGAVDILSGRMREFTSREGAVRVAHLLASAAVPSLFQAVDVGDGGLYWDGLFSDNPPLGELIRDDVVGAENIPDEIWVIKINPTTSAHEPKTPDQITDRRNELYGNISLFHQLAGIAAINELFMANAFRPEFLQISPVKKMIRIPRSFAHKPLRPYHMPLIEMSPALQAELDYESKLDRSAAQMRRLMADGAAQAEIFLQARRPVPDKMLEPVPPLMEPAEGEAFRQDDH